MIGRLRATGPREFFDRTVGLTVSGQLQAEMAACALSRVYTFGPTFRADNSMTRNHLAEFWYLLLFIIMRNRDILNIIFNYIDICCAG